MAHRYGTEMTGAKGRLEQTWNVPNRQYSEVDDPRRPLIERSANHWQNEKATYLDQAAGSRASHCDFQDHSQSVVSSRRFRRMLLIVSLLICLAFGAWQWHLHVQRQEDREIAEGFLLQDNGTYGIAKSKGRHFDGVRMQTLEPNLLPGGVDDPEGERRLVFVGDIHGCAHELKKLLEKVRFDEQRDHLIAVGDTISKGPYNVEVLDELMRLGATSVRGNHEDRILAIAPSVLSSLSMPREIPTETQSRKDEKLLRELEKWHIEYLKGMPLMLRVPALPMAGTPTHKRKSPLAEEIIVVHAGLVPAVSLDRQDPFYVMNMRSIQTKTHLPLIEAAAKKSKSKPWRKIWEWYNSHLFRGKSLKKFDTSDELTEESWDSWLGWLGVMSRKKWPEPQVVVYGHHAKAGRRIERWSKGLDTGCVRGGKLTAMVLDARGKQKIVSVKCQDHR